MTSMAFRHIATWVAALFMSTLFVAASTSLAGIA